VFLAPAARRVVEYSAHHLLLVEAVQIVSKHVEDRTHEVPLHLTQEKFTLLIICSVGEGNVVVGIEVKRHLFTAHQPFPVICLQIVFQEKSLSTALISNQTALKTSPFLNGLLNELGDISNFLSSD
jgi:hypothetical protein